jgi:hypothetical protein
MLSFGLRVAVLIAVLHILQCSASAAHASSTDNFLDLIDEGQQEPTLHMMQEENAPIVGDAPTTKKTVNEIVAEAVEVEKSIQETKAEFDKAMEAKKTADEAAADSAAQVASAAADPEMAKVAHDQEATFRERAKNDAEREAELDAAVKGAGDD